MNSLFSLSVPFLILLDLACTAAEPTAGSNGWTNLPGLVEGKVTTRPVDITLPRPPLGYVEYLPKGYDPADSTTKWPLLIYCAGIGEKGDGTDSVANGHKLYVKMTTHGPLYQVVTKLWDFPAIVIAPQQPGYWNNATILKPVFEYMKANYHVDTNRMYLTGLCDGAVATLNFASQHPGYLAGIMPIEAAALPAAGAAANIKDLPMWAVHCFSDPEIARTSSVAWVNQAAQADGIAADVMATYPGYAGKPYFAAVDCDPATGLPLNPFGPTTTIFGCSLTNGSTWIGFGTATFGSAAFNSWGSTDALPYARLNLGVAPDIWAKPGVMFRDSTAPGAMQVMVAQGPNNEVFMQWRTNTNGTTSATSRLGGSTSVKWVKLAKVGSLFTGSYSLDGTNWTTMASKSVVFANTNYLAGIEANSHNNSKSYAQDFTGLTIGGSTPGPLTGVDIGNPALPGSASYANGTWTVKGSGADIWGTADQFNYYYTSVSGDQTIIARIGSNAVNQVVALGKPNGLYLTRPYTGPTVAKQDIYLQIPVGYNATANYDASLTTWVWQRNQKWDRTRSAKRIFTMCWYQNHVQGWVDTYSNGDCWDWMMSQQLAAIPVIASQPQHVTVPAGQTAAFSVMANGALLVYQWTRNGGVIVGANASSYVTSPTSSGDNGAVFAVTVSNPTGSVTSSAALLTVDSSGNVITVSSLGSYRVVQRSIGTTSGTILVTGTYGGMPDHVQARVTGFDSGAIAVDWITIVGAPVGQVYSANLVVPQGGWYKVEVRSCGPTGIPLASAVGAGKWGVGINILCIGQSNMLGLGDKVFTVADDRVGLLYGGATWKHMADPWISGGKASCGPSLGNMLVTALDVPVGLIPVAAGTTYMVGNSWNVLSRRTAANHSDISTVYGQSLSAALTAGGIEFVVVSQGANEAVAGTVSISAYVTAFNQMRSYFSEDLPNGAAVRFSLSQLGRRVDAASYDLGYNAIREAHRLLDNGTSVFLAGNTMDFTIVDSTSHYGGVGQATHGRRFARSLLYSLGRSSTYGGPRIDQARFLDDSLTSIRVTISQRGGTDFVPATAIPGFLVYDANGVHAVNAARVNGNTIDLTGYGTPSGSTTITYLAGMKPAGPVGLFADNQTDPESLLPITVPFVVLAPVTTAPIISIQPLSRMVEIGQPVTFSVVASGSGTLTYQWYRTGNAILGAGTSTYTIGATSAGDSGAVFSVIVSNPVGQVVSLTAFLTIGAQPSIEPYLAINGWTNRDGVVEGAINVRPVNTTTPRPPYGYLDYLPRGYNLADTDTNWPLLVYLPSAIESGDGTDSDANGHQLYNQLVRYGPLFQVVNQQWDFPAIIIAPQVTTNWAKPSNVKSVVEYAKANYHVDVNRIYMTGKLDGASGTLRFAVAYPTDLAAILTIEANIAASPAQATLIKHLPMWAAHSFADPTFARANSIGWIDALSVADYGGASDLMETYPGYGSGAFNRSHFAVDFEQTTHRPMNPNGDITTISGATLAPGSKTITFPSGVSYGSGIFGMWSGSETLPFARVQVAGDPTVYIVAKGFASSLTLTASYAGTATTANVSIQTPVGYHATAYRDPNGAWGWNRDQPWDRSHSDRRVITLFWYQTPTNSWIQTWGNVGPWNWMLNQAKSPLGSG